MDEVWTIRRIPRAWELQVSIKKEKKVDNRIIAREEKQTWKKRTASTNRNSPKQGLTSTAVLTLKLLGKCNIIISIRIRILAVVKPSLELFSFVPFLPYFRDLFR